MDNFAPNSAKTAPRSLLAVHGIANYTKNNVGSSLISHGFFDPAHPPSSFALQMGLFAFGRLTVFSLGFLVGYFLGVNATRTGTIYMAAITSPAH